MTDVIKLLEPIKEKELKTTRPDKRLYASNLVTKIVCEDTNEILEHEWIVTNCEIQEDMEDNYNNKLRQKLAEKALFLIYIVQII